MSMSAAGRIRHVATADLDGDSRTDLAALSITGHAAASAYHLSVFFQRANRTFPEMPDIVWDLDRGSVALDLSPRGARPGSAASIYSLRSDGVWLNRFDRRRGAVDSSPVLNTPLEHLVPTDEWVAVVDFVADWRGHGDEVLVPLLPHPRLFSLNGPGPAGGIVLETAPVATYWTSGSDNELRAATLNLMYAFPLPVAADQNGDGRAEIAFVERNRVTVFDTTGSAEAKTLSKTIYPVKILTDEEAASDHFTTRTRLLDLNGDGRADLLAVVFRETGIFHIEGRVLVFICRPDGSFDPEPDQHLQVNNALYNLVHVLDLDGDGTREIIIPSAKLGLWGYLRVLTTRKVSFDLNTVSYRGESGFDVAGMTTDSMTARLSKDYDFPVIKLDDINGDGHADVLIGSAEDRICIHEGTREGDRRFREKPASCFEANPYAVYTVIDLENDGKRELVRYDPRGDNPGRLVLTLIGG